MIVGVGSIWPSPPCRKKCPPLQKLRSVNLKVLEGALLRTTLEVAVLHKYRSEGVKAGVHEAVSGSKRTLGVLLLLLLLLGEDRKQEVKGFNWKAVYSINNRTGCMYIRVCLYVYACMHLLYLLI